IIIIYILTNYTNQYECEKMIKLLKIIGFFWFLLSISFSALAEGKKVKLSNLKVKWVTQYGTYQVFRGMVDVENVSQDRLQGSLCMEAVDADGFKLKHTPSEEARLVPGKKVTVGPMAKIMLDPKLWKDADRLRVYWGFCIANPSSQEISNVIEFKIKK
ncbi:hypothetical protein N9Y50_07805, partial [Alphaproteobacteria bacterium]|nr:hypothetical protein [Alphaproteobacteria bacterium]